MNENRIIETALVCFGIDKQRIKCIEEMSELQKELCKSALGRGNFFNLADEIADVIITVKQMIKHYDVADLVKERYEYKLERLAGQLNMTEDEWR